MVQKVEREWTEEVYEVDFSVLVDAEENMMTHYFGVLMDWGNYYQFVPTVLAVGPKMFSSISDKVKKEYEESNAKGNITDFFTAHFSDYLVEFFQNDESENILG